MEIIVFAFGEFRISAGAGGWRRQQALLAAAAPQPDNRARSLAGELDRPRPRQPPASPHR
jgi:hypothetical protein